MICQSAPRTGVRSLLQAVMAVIMLAAILVVPPMAFGQGTGKAAPKGSATGAAKNGAAKPAATTVTHLQPIFPAQNNNLIFVEGEDAVVTNFDKQAILNYSASGLRTLQLSSTSDPSGGSGYYADYVFYVDKAGTYEFWYGGTPPGPSESTLPSYSSPFSYTIDNGDPVTVYSENVTEGGSYTPLYYWNRVGSIKLSAGKHQIRFQVTQKRRFDGRYFFYLDAFFLVRDQNGTADPGKPLPAVFPAHLGAGTKGYPLKFIEDYLIKIRDNPADIQAYIDLSLAYSMVGDNLNALKYLNRASELDPTNETVTLLKAKNLLWKGDVTNGLATYQALLKKDPSKVGLWAEAGKVAAWSGKYSDSINFFEEGLKHFPKNLNLMVNLGLTYLWSGDQQKAQTLFTEARDSVSSDYSGLMRLAQILAVAQANDRAVEMYQSAIKAFPRHLEGYLALEKLYLDMGNPKAASEVRKQISDSFIASSHLNQFLDISQVKQNLKNQVIAAYEDSLAKQPDNLGLRELLARAYFWNGYQEKGTAEYLNILVNQTYRKLRSMESSSEPLLTLLDRSYIFAQYYQQVPNTVQQLQKSLTDGLAAYQSAAKELADYQKKVDTARQKGQAVPPPANGDPQQKVQKAEQEVAATIAKAQSYFNAFDSVGGLLKQDQGKLTGIQDKAKSNQSAFQKLIQASNWHWREEDTIAELEQVTSSGVDLANYSIATIEQIQGRLSSAAEHYRKGASGSNPLFPFELSQTLLWMGNPAQAATELEKVPADNQERKTVGQWPTLQKTLATNPAPTNFIATTPDPKLIQDVVNRLDTVANDARTRLTAINADQTVMHAILRNRLLRAVYQNQEDTFQLRRDLGDYYLQQKRFQDAIRQFRQVLAIDPWNVGALYRLGQVYAMQGNWKQALANYEKVYYSDPTYENVVHQYNVLARQHPDTLSFDSQMTTDTQRVQYQASADYLTHITSLIGLELHYVTNSQRLFLTYSTENPSNYLTNTLYVGLPLDIYGIKLKINPQFGATIVNALDQNQSSPPGALPTASITPAGYFGYLSLDPTVKVNAQLSIGKYLFLSGDYTYGRQQETYVPARLSSNIFQNTMDLNVTTNLGFIGGYPFKNSSFRGYGELDLLSDSNYIYTGLAELDLGVVNIPKSSTNLTLIGSAQLQSSNPNVTPTLYYAPMGELLAGGGFSASTWVPVGNDSIGLSLRGMGSSYIQKIFQPSTDWYKMYQVSGEGRVEYDRGTSALYLDTSFSATYQYAGPPTTTSNVWNYWSMTVSLGYSTQLPTLLAP